MRNPNSSQLHRRSAAVKMCIAALTLALASATAIGVAYGQVQTPSIREDNRLANGGFEEWPYGNLVQGPIPPAQWFPNGKTLDLFTQTDIYYTRISLDAGDIADGASGAYAVEIATLNPGNFIAQDLESFQEFKGAVVTFSASFR